MRADDLVKHVKETNFKLIIERIKLFFINPREAWRAIKAQNPSVDNVMCQDLFVVAGIGSAVEFVRAAIFRTTILFYGREQFSAISAFGHALLMFIMVLLTTYLVASLVDFVATTEMFSADSERETSFHLVAYPTIIALVGQIGLLLPYIGTLICLAGFVYAIYLIYLGTEELFNVEKKPRFFAAVLLSWFLVLVLVGAVQNLMFPAPILTR